ncbi:MAG: PaaI family thioesterase [Bacteroidales bacterium]|nr:PaaI family thioesterase [Bacteroidales bacterium]
MELITDWSEKKHTLLKYAIEKLMPANQIFGIKVNEIKEGYVHFEIPFKDEFVGDLFNGLWHGGILASIADTAGGFAVGSKLETNLYRVNTIEMTIKYLKGSKKKNTVFAEAKVSLWEGKMAEAKIVLYQDRIDDPVCTANCSYIVLPTKSKT